MIRIDLHVHTRFSSDANTSPKLIVDQLYAHPLIKGVAITDHDTLEGYLHVCRLAEAYEDILVVPGIEFSTEQGHVTVLGVEEESRRPLTVEEVVDFAKERGGLVVVPHPYRALGLGDAARSVQVDAIEVLNARATHQENKMAERLARERNLPGVAGSDAHRPQSLWTAYTEAEAEPNVESVLDAIRRGVVKVASVRL